METYCTLCWLLLLRQQAFVCTTWYSVNVQYNLIVSDYGFKVKLMLQQNNNNLSLAYFIKIVNNRK